MENATLRDLLIKSIDKRLGDVHTVLCKLVEGTGRALTIAEARDVAEAEETLSAVRIDVWKLAHAPTAS